jgi:Ca2+-binding RTX toxin-like protein
MTHVLTGAPGKHNYLLGGYGDDTIYGGHAGDVIWGDFHPTGSTAASASASTPSATDARAAPVGQAPADTRLPVVAWPGAGRPTG